MEKETLLVIFGGLKGGNGKSTCTEAVATEIHVNRNRTCCVLDADDDQQTLFEERQEEIESGADASGMYPIVGLSSADVPDQIDAYLGEYDYTFIDLPGNFRQPGVGECYAMADIIFIPFDIGSKDIRSLRNFLKKFYEIIYPARNANGIKTEITLFMNKVNPKMTEVTDFEQHRDSIIPAITEEIKQHCREKGMDEPEVHLEMMENFIPEVKTDFQRNSSTITPIRSSSKNRDYRPFFDEIYSIMEREANNG